MTHMIPLKMPAFLVSLYDYNLCLNMVF
jgi:hypothetical protein